MERYLMLRPSVGLATFSLLALLPSCSLLINTSPDGLANEASAGAKALGGAGTQSGGATSMAGMSGLKVDVAGSAGRDFSSQGLGGTAHDTSIPIAGGAAGANIFPEGGAIAGGTTGAGIPDAAGAGGTIGAGGTAQVGGTSTSGGTTAQCVAGTAQDCIFGNFRGRQPCTAEGQYGSCSPLISLGSSHACLVTSTGNLKCWGSNSSGQLGQDTETISKLSTPTTVAAAVSAVTSNIMALSAGSSHTCVVASIDVATTRTVCWGSNYAGQLGAATPAESFTPIVVQGLTDAVEVYAGNGTTCARTRSGSIKCWGSNSEGAIGNGTSSDPIAIPTAINYGGAPITMDAGSGHNCLIDSDHRVFCWGDDFFGQTGVNGTVPAEICLTHGTCYTAPTQVDNLSDVVQVSAAYGMTCATKSSGAVHCWGKNHPAVLGTPPTSGPGAIFPTSVSGLELSDWVGVGGDQACAVTRSGSVQCWGNNTSNALGIGESSGITTAATPVQPIGLNANVSRLLSGDNFFCVVKSNSMLWCWGDTSQGQAGVDSAAMTSIAVPTQLNFSP